MKLFLLLHFKSKLGHKKTIHNADVVVAVRLGNPLSLSYCHFPALIKPAKYWLSPQPF